MLPAKYKLSTEKDDTSLWIKFSKDGYADFWFGDPDQKDSERETALSADEARALLGVLLKLYPLDALSQI